MNLSSTRHARAMLSAAVRPRLPRPVILIAAVLMLLAISTAARSNPAEASTSQKPTIVLVHGAWGATTIEFDDASHAGGFTHYSSRFVKLIEQAAQATTH